MLHSVVLENNDVIRCFTAPKIVPGAPHKSYAIVDALDETGERSTFKVGPIKAITTQLTYGEMRKL